MPVETKKRIQFWAIIGLAATILAAAITVLILFFTNRAAKANAATKMQAEPPLAAQQTLPQSEYTAADFTYDGDYLTCWAAETLMGIDVSHHQSQIDWEQVAEAGVDFVMVRLGYRGLNGEGLYEDRYVRQNLQGARDAGLLVGAYFYSQAITTREAEEEALYALEILGDFQLDLPLVYDWEQEYRTENMTTKEVTACSAAFCRIIENAGCDPMIYFNSHQAVNLMELAYLTEYPWWLAMYDTEAEFPCRFDMWQYSCTGTVPGIEGYVDLDILILSD